MIKDGLYSANPLPTKAYSSEAIFQLSMGPIAPRYEAESHNAMTQLEASQQHGHKAAPGEQQ